MKLAGWINLMCRSSNPITRAHGMAVKERLEAEYRRDWELLMQSPAYTGKKSVERLASPQENP